VSVSPPLFLICALSLLAGCNSLPTHDLGALAAQHIELARAHEGRGELASALFQWRVAAALAPDDAEVRNGLRRVTEAREAQARKWRDTGLEALSRGQYRQARQYLYRAWVLTPEDAVVREELRRLEQRRLERQMVAKVARSRRALNPGPQTDAAAEQSSEQAAERDYLANELSSRAHPTAEQPPASREPGPQVQRLLDQAEGLFRQQDHGAVLKKLSQARELAQPNQELSAQVQALRRAYANRVYADGVRAATADPTLALSLWRRALDYDPGHAKAALRIRRSSATRPTHP
jgi:hypothetical protein